MRISSTGPTTEIPKRLLSLSHEATTVGAALADVAEFSVPKGAGKPLVALNGAATALEQNAALASKLTGIADLVRETPDGKLDRLTLAPTHEGFMAARAAARFPVMENFTAARGERLLRQMAHGAARFVEGEYLPSRSHLLLGPLASNGVLGAFAGMGPETTTRPGYVVAHEIAHARQPVDSMALNSQTVRATEEARADLVVRLGDLPQRVESLTGLPIDIARLDDDPTYHAERDQLILRLGQMGMGGGNAHTAALLDATSAVDLIRQFGIAH